MKKVEIKNIAGTYGTVKWLYAGKPTVRLLGSWNEYNPGTHAILERDGENIAVGRLTSEGKLWVVEEISGQYHALTDNAQSHARQILLRALESDQAQDTDSVEFSLTVI